MTRNVTRMLTECFDRARHKICLFDHGECSIDAPAYSKSECIRVTVIKHNLRSYARLCRLSSQYDAIVLHGFYFDWIFAMYCSFFRRDINRKIILIEYGEDVRMFDGRSTNRFLRWIQKLSFRRFIKSINAFVAIFPPDLDWFKAKFKPSYPCTFIPYTTRLPSMPFTRAYSPHESMRDRIARGDPVRILVGHRAARTLHHRRCFERLSRFAAENIEVLLPTGQNSGIYADDVVASAKRIFPGKVRVFDHFLTNAELETLAANTDFAIFDCEFQIALGTIYKLFIHGVKVAFPEKSVLGEFFATRGVPVFPVERLDSCTFGELTDPVDMSPGFEYVREIMDAQTNLRKWRDFYDSIESFSAR